MCRVEKDLPSTDAAKADAFNAAVKVKYPTMPGGVTMGVVSKLGVGDSYKTITEICEFEKTETCSLEHKEGEVWLLDFWATWCPPC